MVIVVIDLHGSLLHLEKRKEKTGRKSLSRMTTCATSTI